MHVCSVLSQLYVAEGTKKRSSRQCTQTVSRSRKDNSGKRAARGTGRAHGVKFVSQHALHRRQKDNHKESTDWAVAECLFEQHEKRAGVQSREGPGNPINAARWSYTARDRTQRLFDTNKHDRTRSDTRGQETQNSRRIDRFVMNQEIY